MSEKKIEGLVIKGEGKEEFIPVEGLRRKMILITINYTNERLAHALQEEGVPLIEHKDIEESKTRALREKAYQSLRFGGNATRVYFAHQRGCVIEGTGRPLFQRQGVRVGGQELIQTVLTTFEGRRIFMRTRKVMTDIAIQRNKKFMKCKTMLFLVPDIPEKVQFSKKNTVEVTHRLPATYLRLINAAYWLGGVFLNPDGVAIELTGKQPGVRPTHQILFKI